MRHYRIAFYMTDLDPSHGGIERVTYFLSRELTMRGYLVYAIHTNDLPNNRIYYSHYVGLIQGDSTRPKDLPEIIHFIKENNIDIFLNQIFTSHSSVDLQKAIKRDSSAKLIDVFHTTPTLLDSLNVFNRSLPIPNFLNSFLFSIHKAINLKPLYRKGNRESYYLSDAFVMLSTHYFTEFINDNKIKDSSKLLAIANPIDHSINTVCKKERIILVVARLNNHQKRVDRTLQFWKEFHKRDDGWKLLIVGDGPDRQKLETMATKLELSDYCFTGHCSNPKEYYEKSMIFMMTSDVEGFSMTLLEAMSCGCVPIAMNTFSALPDIITDGKDGMIIPKDEIKGMITAVKHVTSNFDEMSAKAMLSAKRFAIGNIADKWEKLLNRVQCHL